MPPEPLCGRLLRATTDLRQQYPGRENPMAARFRGDSQARSVAARTMSSADADRQIGVVELAAECGGLRSGDARTCD